MARELGSVPKAAELDEAAEARELDERTRETVVGRADAIARSLSVVGV